MNIFLSKSAVEIEFQSVDFVLKTQQQIAKDFNLSAVDFDALFLSQELDYDEILIEVQAKLVEVMKFGETQLLQLMYQIDIPQSQFLDLLGKSTIAEELSELILRREAYKVYLRSKF